MSFERRRLKTGNMRNNFPVRFSDRKIIRARLIDARVKEERDRDIPRVSSVVPDFVSFDSLMETRFYAFMSFPLPGLALR